MKTTLNKIRKYNPCNGSWVRLLNHLGKTEADDEALHLSVILDLLGLEDAIWALRAVDGRDKEIRLFACDCAEHVLPIYEAQCPDDPTVRKCIEVARRYAGCEATSEEMTVAAWAARAAAKAAKAAAWAASRDAAKAANAAKAAKAANAAWAASRDAWAAADAAWDAAAAAAKAARADANAAWVAAGARDAWAGAGAANAAWVAANARDASVARGAERNYQEALIRKLIEVTE